VGALAVPYEAEILLVSDSGVVIRMDLADVRPLGRATQGVSLMRPGEGSSVVAVARVVEDDVDDAEDDERGDALAPVADPSDVVGDS
jgi:DNA gyrase subunit A